MDALTSRAGDGRLAFCCLVPVWASDPAETFVQAMETIAASTLRPTEVLIAADGALTPELDAAVAECLEAGARLVRNPGQRGLHHNLNHALSEVSAPYVARFDADDLNLPDRFAAQAAFLEANPGISVVGGGIIEFWPDGRRREKRLPVTHEEIVRLARWRNPINHMTAFFRLKDVVDVGGYPALPLKEDYALWLRLIGAGRLLANLPRALVQARLGADFHRRRSGLRNLASEVGLFRIKRRIRHIGLAPAAAALAARASVLCLEGPTALVYERVLRR